ncbi:hypothetical protein CPLU01_03160 [Colletotrichum plurivorum]|uniref:Uncharacterized protein n=1 Tax=Colletotrichum plurivorum TaxID=2175906 RepID=A0A8H6KUR3_9PEZI|nr:hypothetical protein CPLU01_03160 [Colletotrichum plurivorum]
MDLADGAPGLDRDVQVELGVGEGSNGQTSDGSAVPSMQASSPNAHPCPAPFVVRYIVVGVGEEDGGGGGGGGGRGGRGDRDRRGKPALGPKFTLTAVHLSHGRTSSACLGRAVLSLGFDSIRVERLYDGLSPPSRCCVPRSVAVKVVEFTIYGLFLRRRVYDGSNQKTAGTEILPKEEHHHETPADEEGCSERPHFYEDEALGKGSSAGTRTARGNQNAAPRIDQLPKLAVLFMCNARKRVSANRLLAAVRPVEVLCSALPVPLCCYFEPSRAWAVKAQADKQPVPSSQGVQNTRSSRLLQLLTTQGLASRVRGRRRLLTSISSDMAYPHIH